MLWIFYQKLFDQVFGLIRDILPVSIANLELTANGFSYDKLLSRRLERQATSQPVLDRSYIRYKMTPSEKLSDFILSVTPRKTSGAV